MRKQNSEFLTAFISEASRKIKNTDYFGFVELDNYACYVIADGITNMREALGAKAAISAVIDAFQREPGISKRKIKGYLKSANRELLQGKSYEKQKASVTAVVTDYVKFRYGHVGNTRLRLYREGRCILATSDMSLSQDMVQEGAITQDKVARHEERNNLYAYLGREHFKPFVSKKKKLCNGDIITLYTRGIWENVDEGELADVFLEAGNEPMEECDKVEDLLLYDEGDTLALGGLTIQVLHTPGHSPGSVTLKAGDVLFTGDTLFAGTCGRTDFPGGDYGEMMASLKRLGELEGNFRVLPGHESFSTLDQERKTNPYLRMAMG